MPAIRGLEALEILDSRGHPTLRARCILEDGTAAAASVPSGASTGSAEAKELRDGDPERYAGLGCRRAAEHVRATISDALRGRELPDQPALDEALLELDGTPDKSRLGANAVLAVSLAFARAHARSRGIPLYRHLGELVSGPVRHLPRMTINLFSGGLHAGGQVPIQDVLVVPIAAATVDEGLATAHSVYRAAADLVRERYRSRALTADEGGLAPDFPDADAMLTDAVEAIERADLRPGTDVALAVDVAATHFFRNGRYHLHGRPLTGADMADTVTDWIGRFPIVSVEDPLAEEDWDAWAALRRRLEVSNPDVLLVGDDLLCTHPERIHQAVETRAASALLLKVNQVGTLTEAARALSIARGAGWAVTASARSGETEDDWLADLAVGWSADQIKVGSITRSERLAKYNRLLEIEAETGLPVVAWPGRGSVS